MKKVHLVSTIALLQAAPAAVINSSFEGVSFGTTAQFPAASSGLISPWDHSAGVGMIPNADTFGGDTSSGSQYVAMKGSGTISQNFNLAAGAYTLEFTIAPYSTNQTIAGTVTPTFTGTDVTSTAHDTAFGAGIVGYNSGNDQPMDETVISIPFNVTGPSQSLSLLASSATIDNVTITPVPEPSASLLGALAGLIVFTRRKRS